MRGLFPIKQSKESEAFNERREKIEAARREAAEAKTVEAKAAAEKFVADEV